MSEKDYPPGNYPYLFPKALLKIDFPFPQMRYVSFTEGISIMPLGPVTPTSGTIREALTNTSRGFRGFLNENCKEWLFGLILFGHLRALYGFIKMIQDSR